MPVRRLGAAREACECGRCEGQGGVACGEPGYGVQGPGPSAERLCKLVLTCRHQGAGVRQCRNTLWLDELAAFWRACKRADGVRRGQQHNHPPGPADRPASRGRAPHPHAGGRRLGEPLRGAQALPEVCGGPKGGSASRLEDLGRWLVGRQGWL
eukprot:UN2942